MCVWGGGGGGHIAALLIGEVKDLGQYATSMCVITHMPR